MSLELQWRGLTRLPVAAEGLAPATLAPLSPAERDRWPLRVGNRSVPLAELFRIEGSIDDGHLVLEGDLGQFRRLGRGMTTGRLTIRGNVGTELGAEMTGGTIDVQGSVGDWAGPRSAADCSGSRETPETSSGAAYPGRQIGMREGVILVEGNVGDETGLAMRRGLIAIAGAVGRRGGAGLDRRFDLRLRPGGPPRGGRDEAGHAGAYTASPSHHIPNFCPRSHRAGDRVLPSSRSTSGASGSGGFRCRNRLSRARWIATMGTLWRGAREKS